MSLLANSSNDYESYGDKINVDVESPGMAKPNLFVYSSWLVMGNQYHFSKAEWVLIFPMLSKQYD